MAKNVYKLILFCPSMKVYFSHLRHLELTHRKLTHMYMFLMMSGIFLQHFPVNKTMLYKKMAKNIYKLILFYHSMKVYFHI